MVAQNDQELNKYYSGQTDKFHILLVVVDRYCIYPASLQFKLPAPLKLHVSMVYRRLDGKPAFQTAEPRST